jgi:hypothetical protein
LIVGLATIPSRVDSSKNKEPISRAASAVAITPAHPAAIPDSPLKETNVVERSMIERIWFRLSMGWLEFI